MTDTSSEEDKPRGKHAKGGRGQHAAGSATGLEGLQSEAVSSFVPANPSDTGPFQTVSEFPDFTGGVKARGREHRALKITAIVLGSLLALIVAVYVAGAVVFMDRFFPRTVMGEFDVSLMSTADAADLLERELADYRLSVEGDGISFTLTAEEAGLGIDAEEVLSDARRGMNPWMWPFELTRSHDETASLVATCNESGLERVVSEHIAAFNETAVQPKDASIAFDEAVGAYVVVPEELGTALDEREVLKAIDEAIMDLDETLTLDEEALARPAVLRTSPELTSARDAANLLIDSNITLMISDVSVGHLDGTTLAQWITFDENLSPHLDDAQLTAWVDALVPTINSVGVERTYTRYDGKVVTVSGGSYGWDVDRDALLTLVRDNVAAGYSGELAVPLYQWAWWVVTPGEPDWGPSYVDIDLSEQYARYYDESGTVIWESAVITGIPDGIHDTPCGVFKLNSKASPSKLVGWENGQKIYETEVTFWMPFDGNVIGLHDATWQPAFGGTLYRDGLGSHGCVNLPYSAAESLYYMLPVDTPVIVHW